MGTLVGTKLSACVVVYKPTEEVLETVRCLVESTAEPEVFVVNNSPKDTAVVDKIAKKWKTVTVLESRKNLGYGEGNNVMLDYIRRDYHLICNPDVTFDPELLKRMVAWMDEHPEVGLLSPKVLSPDGTEQFLPRRSPTCRYLLGGPLARIGGRLLRRAEDLAERGQHHRICEAWWRHKGWLPGEEAEPAEPEAPEEDAEPFNPETHVPGTVIDNLKPERRRRQGAVEEGRKRGPMVDSFVRSGGAKQVSPEEELGASARGTGRAGCSGCSRAGRR